MKLFVPRQSAGGETRVALIPPVVKKLIGAGITVTVETGAGAAAFCTDDAYVQAGATIVPADQVTDAWSAADVVVVIQPPDEAQAGRLHQGAVLIGMLAPTRHLPVVQKLAAAGVTAFAMEYLPRISRAQSMDVLSSQANIAGYMSAVLAADACAKMFPMMITAAGTIAPARVFVIGAGVAGLQAIATARRLGAIVEAYDVRPAVKEQVQSLGARFVELPMTKQDAETAGGYAKEQTDQERRQQAELMTKHITGADAVITTAAVFGKAPPLLIPADVVGRMRGGTAIIDLAADADAGRGNCALTKPGERVTVAPGVVIDGRMNLPTMLPIHASQAYAANMQAFLKEIVADGQVKLNLEDEIQKGAASTHNGVIVHPLLKQQ